MSFFVRRVSIYLSVFRLTQHFELQPRMENLTTYFYKLFIPEHFSPSYDITEMINPWACLFKTVCKPSVLDDIF